jgi:predicted PurR-regulated permease PerM
MKDLKITNQEKKALALATVAAVGFGAYFLSSYFYMFVIAGVLAYLFNPIYEWLLKRMRASYASGLTLLASFFAIVIPVTLVFLIAGFQLKNSVDSITTTITGTDLTQFGTDMIDGLNRLLNSIPFINVSLTQEDIYNSMATAVSSLGSTLVNSLASIASSVGSFVATTIIYIYVFLSVLRNGDKLLVLFKKMNPLGEQISELYISRTAAMVRGTVQGQFIIAACQGFLGAITVALVGYPNLFFVLFIVFTLFSIIPLGAGILLIPIGMFMILIGNVSGGAIVILEHLLINTNIDNVLRPKLVPKEARLDSALMLVSVFAGMRFFGFLGIIIGPTIMVIIVTTVKVYLEVFENYKVVEDKKIQKKKLPRRLFGFGRKK